jgi:S-adenosylmethionine decarboxylase proenzyme
MATREQPKLYVADLKDCSRLATFTAETLRAAFIGALERAGATIVGSMEHGFSGTGVTCIAILAESHAVLHTWPESGVVNIDIFSCTQRLKSIAAIEELGRLLGAAEVTLQETPRSNGVERNRT